MATYFLQRSATVRLLGIFILLFAVGTAVAQDSRAAAPNPALLDLVRETLDRNPGVLAARAAVDAAEARARGAGRPLYNPQLEMEAEQSETRVGSLGLSQAIDWTDKRGARTGVADARLSAVRAEYVAVRQQLGGELLASLGRYQAAQSLKQLADQRVALMQRFLDLAEKRRQAGDLSQVELDLARLAHTQATLQLSQTASDLATAWQALAAITGQSRRDWPALSANLPSLQSIDTESMLTRLPALRAAQARVSAARSTVALRTRERRPDPTLGARAGQERSFRNGNDDQYGLVGLTLSIPLYIRNDFRAEVDASRAELAQAEQSLQDRYRRARARLLSAADRYRLSHSAWAAWLHTGLASLGSQVSLLERIWQTGEMSTADYLVQLNQTLDTRTNALDVQGRLWTAWADWLAASGRIDAWLGQSRQR
ncbi:MAG TPA: TolC family protein [Gammaproteobacteria bacterium]|nr:TolC family protein [Gammaproteobacteria bacterium]